MAKKRKIHVKKHTENEKEEVSFLNDVSTQEQPINQVEESEYKEEAPMQNNESTTEASETQPDSEYNLGQYLKHHRTQKGLTLQHLAHVTKISSKNLELLEDNELELLPNKIYIAGYVKNYAKVLSLDQNACIELLNKEYTKTEPSPVAPEMEIEETVQESSQNDQSTNIKIIAIICCVVFLIILIFIFSDDDSKNEVVQKEVITEVPEQTTSKNQEVLPQSLSAETPLQDDLEVNQVESQDTVSALKEEIEKKEKVETKKEVVEEKEEKKVEEEEEEELTKKYKDKNFYDMRTPLYSELEETSSNSFDAIAPATVKENYKEGQQNILIKTDGGDSWVTYKVDDSSIKQRYLKDGNFTFITGKEVRMAIGNIGIVQINLNKKPIEIKSKTGVKNIVFPQENSSKYKMPLFVYNKENNTFKTAEEYIKLLELQKEASIKKAD